jgi:cytochrome c-type biogenesis protein CcmH
MRPTSNGLWRRVWRTVDPVSRILLLAVLSLALPALAIASPRASLTDIEDEVMCPICGTLLELSNAPQAERERAFIRDQIDRGKTKSEIKDALVREYGRAVLAEPKGSGFDLAAWIVPGLAVILAAAGLALGVSRWRRSGDHAPPRDISPAEAEKLEADMARYDL